MSRTRSSWLLAPGFLLFLAGCRMDMHDSPKAKTFRVSEFFDDRMSARPLVPGTVSQDQRERDDLLMTGKLGGKPADVFPFPVTREVVERGRNRFDIFCSPCHSRTGAGDGMIVRRGFRRPPSYHIDRLRKAPAGHFFDVITNGFGAMYSYADRIAPRDRWAIIAYIRALQLSQPPAPGDTPAVERGGPRQ